MTSVTSSLTTESPGVALLREPAGPVLEGDTVKIVCRIHHMRQLDFVRLVRRPLLNSRGHSDVITTNGVIQGRFKDVSRYRVIHWDDVQGVVQLQITGN